MHLTGDLGLLLKTKAEQRIREPFRFSQLALCAVECSRQSTFVRIWSLLDPLQSEASKENVLDMTKNGHRPQTICLFFIVMQDDLRKTSMNFEHPAI